MRVLLLTASYGSGHNEAARNLAAAFTRDGAEVRVLDHFHAFAHHTFAWFTRALYQTILRQAPRLWSAAYELADRMPSDSPMTFGVTRIGSDRLARFLDKETPDAVVTVHATPSVAMSALAAEGHRLPPHTTVVTDFVAHSQWIASNIDRYCVAAEEVKHEFIARGVPPSRVVVTGVPVRAEFEEPVDGLAVRRELGLAADVPVVLAMAGSRGSLGRLEDVAEVLRASPRPVQGLLVAGHDRGLEARLRHVSAGTRLRVFGYVSDVRRLMAASDLLVTKAGGMTIAEAIVAGLPLVTYGSLPGQERRNERFTFRTGIALVARSRAELARTIERALTEPELLDHLRKQIRFVRQPHAARRIVNVVLGRGPVF